MISFARSGLRGVLVATVVAMGSVGTPVAAQSQTIGEQPVALESKTASKLLVKQVTPEYPSIARVNYIRGQVRMLITVGPSGRVSLAHVVQGHPFLAKPVSIPELIDAIERHLPMRATSHVSLPKERP